MSPSEFAADLRVLWQLARGQSRRGSHADRLNAFYGPQAARYDQFRARLLHGRGEVVEALAVPPGARFVELGCGTGANLELLARTRSLSSLTSITLVDLCAPLLTLARARAAEHVNVEVIEADATTWRPPEPVDRVLLSYALTMMPDWRATLANALAMLAPGGRIGVVDFHLPQDGGRLGNACWRRWFAHDGVHLSDTHTTTLRNNCQTLRFDCLRAPLPYLPGLRVPYYLFVGVKR